MVLTETAAFDNGHGTAVGVVHVTAKPVTGVAISSAMIQPFEQRPMRNIFLSALNSL